RDRRIDRCQWNERMFLGRGDTGPYFDAANGLPVRIVVDGVALGREAVARRIVFENGIDKRQNRMSAASRNCWPEIDKGQTSAHCLPSEAGPVFTKCRRFSALETEDRLFLIPDNKKPAGT